MPALLAALVAAGFSAVIIFALYVTQAAEFAPLPVRDAAMRRYAEAGSFPLMAAASAAGRHALATGAGLQTFGGLFIVFMSFAFGGWRGFSNPRLRGWSNGFWMAAVAALSLSTTIFPGLTLQKLDYAIGADGFNTGMAPLGFLLERGLFSALAAAFFLVLGHDLGYRMREALEDFGVIEPDVERRESPRSFKTKGAAGRARDDAGRQEAGGGFGQRGAPPAWEPPSSEETRARAVLGVGASASKREIERAYRAQMKRAHPDHGGSVARAAALNAARDLLLGR